MPADAQDTHIMKAHLRKHEVFHNIANARENVVFNNSLGDRKRGSQHLVEMSFQRLEDTDMRKIKTGEFPDVGWSVGRLVGRSVGLPACWLACLLAGWLGTPNPSIQRRRPLHPRGGETVAELPSATPRGGNRSGGAFRTPPGKEIAREARSTIPSNTYPQQIAREARSATPGSIHPQRGKHVPPSPAAPALKT